MTSDRFPFDDFSCLGKRDLLCLRENPEGSELVLQAFVGKQRNPIRMQGSVEHFLFYISIIMIKVKKLIKECSCLTGVIDNPGAVPVYTPG